MNPLYLSHATKSPPKLLMALSSLIGVILILASTSRYGIGLTSDSVGYIAVARNLIAGNGVINYDGTYHVSQPPFYPALLAIMGYTFGTDPFLVARLVNASIFGFIIYLSAIIVFRYTHSLLLTIIILGMILFKNPLIDVSIMAWSEPLFICLILLFFLCAEAYLVKKSIPLLILLSGIVALISLTRYIGITLIATGGLAILLLCRISFKEKILHLFLFGFISVIPMGGWIFRNYVFSGTFTGERVPSVVPIFDNMSSVLYGIYSWLFPGNILQYRFVLTSVHLVVLILGCVAIGYVWKFTSRKERLNVLKNAVPQVGTIAIFVIVYLIFLIISATVIAQEIDNRLLSPLYIPVMVLVLFFVQKWTELMEKYISKRKVYQVLIAFTVIILLYSLIFIVSETKIRMTQGVTGYTSDIWQKSETIQYLQNHTLESNYPIYSNAPDVLYILANINGGQMSPRKAAHWLSPIINDISQISWPKHTKIYLIWFDNMERSYLFTVDELKTIANISPVIHFADGVIYTVAKKD